MDLNILQQRMQAIYEADKQTPHRRSYENQDVQELYSAEPNSAATHALLHNELCSAQLQTVVVDAVS